MNRKIILPPSLALVALVPLLLGGPCDPLPVVHEVQYGGLTLQYWRDSAVRVGRTEEDVTFVAELRNGSGMPSGAIDIDVALSPGSPHSITSGQLGFSGIAGVENDWVPADSGFTIRVDRSAPFDPDALLFAFDAPDLEVIETPDAARSASALVTEAGGSVTAVAGDGTQYTLQVPAGALAAPETITLTPLLDLASPNLGALRAGVDLEPDGLQLLSPAELSIEPVFGLGNQALVRAGGDGGQLQLVRSGNLSDGVLSFDVDHFSSEAASNVTTLCERIVFTVPPGTVSTRWNDEGDSKCCRDKKHNCNVEGGSCENNLDTPIWHGPTNIPSGTIACGSQIKENRCGGNPGNCYDVDLVPCDPTRPVATATACYPNEAGLGTVGCECL